MKLRRLLTVFVAVLLISLAAAINVSADEGQFEIAVGVSSSTAISKDGLYYVEPGDEIDLTVSITENPGIDSFLINIKYDPELVTPVLDANDHIVVEGVLLPNFSVNLHSANEITINRLPGLVASSTNATGQVTIKFKVTDVICEEIKFEIVTIEALKSSEGSIFPKDYIGNDTKQALKDGLASNVFVAHNYEIASTDAPTCTEYGVIHYACTNCEATIDGVGDAPTGHSPTREDDKQTSCSEPGYLGATICSLCSEILYDRVEIPMIDHHVVDVAATAPTCTTEGLTAGKQCSACKAWIEEQTVIPTVDHTPVDVAGTAATCTTEGLTDGKKCSVCDAVLVAQEKIPAAHGELVDNDGNKVCSVCGVVVEAKVENTTDPSEAPTSEPEPSPEDDGSKKGCKSSVSMGAIAIIAAALVCAPIFKKKEH